MQGKDPFTGERLTVGERAFNLAMSSPGLRTLDVLGDSVQMIRRVHLGGTGARAAGWSDNLADGARLHVDEALDAAEDFLGSGYRDLGNGRFVSQDGLRQVRMGIDDITGQHAGGPHINFERLRPDAVRPGRYQIVENRHLFFWE